MPVWSIRRWNPRWIFSTKHMAGSGNRQNFPMPARLICYWSAIKRPRKRHFCKWSKRTLRSMAEGGVYDQLAGGFHRYSVDERWLRAAFRENVLRQFGAAENYLHGWQVTRNPLFREIAEGIIGWVERGALRPARSVVSSPAKTRTKRWTTTATILPGRWKKFAQF